MEKVTVDPLRRQDGDGLGRIPTADWKHLLSFIHPMGIGLLVGDRDRDEAADVPKGMRAVGTLSW